MKMKQLTSGGLLAVILTGAAAAADTTIVTFENGAEGWDGPQGAGGASFVDASFGHPAPALRTQFNDFGITFRNTTNPAFVGDYTRYDSVDFSVDVYTTSLNFLGLPTPRPFVIEIIDFDTAPAGYPWLSVWIELTILDESNPGWHTLTASIPDTSSATLPAGWQTNIDATGFALPAGVTFDQILSGVDRIQYTTYEPGYFFSNSEFDVSVDNITISGVVPCAGDLDGSGEVDIQDLLNVLAAWGTDDPAADIAPDGGDGIVDILDLLDVLAAWGPCS